MTTDNKTADAKTDAKGASDHAEAGKKHTIQELTETLQRLQADFENYKKRVDKEKQQVAESAKAAVLHQLLPIIDAFDNAIKSKNNEEQFKKGIELINTQLAKIMNSLGIKHIESQGKKFNPNMHEVLIQETRNDCADETITAELQKGYTCDSIILRTSKVKIARNKRDNEEKKDNKAEQKK